MKEGTPLPRSRVLILVVAFRSEKTLTAVLERIPPSLFQTYDCEVLVADDASDDDTFGVADRFRVERRDTPMRLHRNRYMLGYGGSLKVGFAYALKHGFDFVALLHGDGKYAPEELPRLLEPLQRGRADAVLGSRFLDRWEALRNGMPLYRFAGNRVLTGIQNLLLGTALSEFHCGYRAYSTRALRRIPFRLNTDGFHFDTEIIVQLVAAAQRIAEVPVPTYYGEELRHIHGVRYSLSALSSTLKYTFHRAGILFQRRYHPLGDSREYYSLKLGFPSTHQWALDRIEEGAVVIDLGAGPFSLAKELLEKNCKVALVDKVPVKNVPHGAEVIMQDLEEPIPFSLESYDHVLLLDILEHLSDPERFLERLKSHFSHERKTIILSTPNVAFFVQRLMLLLGQFNYGRAGVLDRTHRRLFTFGSLQRLLREEGYAIEEIRGVPAPFPKALGKGRFSELLLRVNQGLIRISRSMFSYQIFVIATSSPSLEFLLADAESGEGTVPERAPSRE